MFGFLGLGTTLAFLDLAIKNQIEAEDPGEFPRTMEGSGGRIRLYRNHNEGFSFGVLKEHRELVTLLPMCMTSAVAGIWAWVTGKKGNFLEKTALTLILAGGVSNLYDRQVRGYVVDYFSIQWKALKKVVFNLGDMFIFTGTVLLVIAQLAEGIRKK